jgi:hypothetical protein
MYWKDKDMKVKVNLGVYVPVAKLHIPVHFYSSM